LNGFLDGLDYSIEHIGATSVPSLVTKGDVDLNIRAKSKRDFDDITRLLRKSLQINQPQNWNQYYSSFDVPNTNPPVGVQVTIEGSEEDWFVKFRDVLSSNKILLEQYNQIKKDFNGESMTSYRKAKHEFIQKVLFS